MSRILFLSCLVFIGGIFIVSFFPGRESVFEPYYGKKAVVQGTIVSDPVPRGKYIQYMVRPYGFGNANILLNASVFSHFQYGDRVQISGKFQAPPVFDDFNYREYLGVKRIYALMWYPKTQLLSRESYENIFAWGYAKILSFKHVLEHVLQQNLVPPERTLLSALVLGDQGQMGNDLKQKLNMTGLRHITAISGQHIVILTNMIMVFLLALGLWKKQAIILAGILMIFFVLLTGSEASSVRSLIMGSFLLAGQYAGRMYVSLRGLVFAAAIMLLLNPALLFHDIGFQLSFLAVLGIVVAMPFFQHLLRKVPEKFGLRDMIAMDFAAQIFTFPILAYNFGYVSIVGIVANLLILPVIPLILGLGFVFLIGGALWGLLGFVLSFPIFFLLLYFNWTIEFFARLPFSSLTVENLSPLWLIPFYGALWLLLWKFKQNQQSADF